MSDCTDDVRSREYSRQPAVLISKSIRVSFIYSSVCAPDYAGLAHLNTGEFLEKVHHDESSFVWKPSSLLQTRLMANVTVKK